MKNIFHLLLLILLIGMSISCDDKNFLEETETTDLSYETVFADSTYTVGFLTEIYRDIGFDTDPGRFSTIYVTFGGLQGACDEVEFRASSTITTDVLFATGTVNPVIVSDDAWGKPYVNIRRVNVFLKNVDKAPLSTARKTVYKAEARFLRAWYYSVLLKHYGGIPLIGDVIYESADEIKTTRDTYKDCVDYIVSECDAAAQDLATKPSGRNYGRVGSGACKALKARVLLYAASPLFNGSNFAPENYPKEIVGYPSPDPDRWRLAMEAAREVIGLNVYRLFVKHTNDDGNAEPGWGFYALFSGADWVIDGAEDGTIFELQEVKGQKYHKLFQPPSRGGGAGGFAYQDLVDCFPMRNGKAITDPTSGYDPNAPYANRDPRFNISITHDQTPLQNGATANVPVNTYLKEDYSPYDGDAVHTGTPTGYYVNKMQHRKTAANYFVGVAQSRPLIRYAEVLLNFAEAANEYAGPSDEIYEALKNIRERAGIYAGVDGMYGLKQGMDQDEMREVIRNERRIELAIEGHRFWDVRRWMIAEETDNKTMTGMEIRRVGNQKTYTRYNVRSHVFRKAMYLWPIPYKEISKSPDLLQNPHY
jgi:hypothetical protein